MNYSLVNVNRSNDGCWVMLWLRWVIPPAFRVIVPTTTLIILLIFPTVQEADVKTKRIVRIDPPQKWKLLIVLNEAMCGTWPSKTGAPPFILPSISLSTISAGTLTKFHNIRWILSHIMLTWSKCQSKESHKPNCFIQHLESFGSFQLTNFSKCSLLYSETLSVFKMERNISVWS